MAGVISYINESVFYEGRRNLAEVTSFFNSGVNLQALMALIKEREPYLSRFTLESFNAYIALSERAAASALLDIQKALRPFRNERIAAATSVTDMDLRALKHRPVSIYLAPNITDITLLKPLLALFVQQTLDTLMLEHTSPVDPGLFPARRVPAAQEDERDHDQAALRRRLQHQDRLHHPGSEEPRRDLWRDVAPFADGQLRLSARLRSERPGHGGDCLARALASAPCATRPNPAPSN